MIYFFWTKKELAKLLELPLLAVIAIDMKHESHRIHKQADGRRRNGKYYMHDIHFRGDIITQRFSGPQMAPFQLNYQFSFQK